MHWTVIVPVKPASQGKSRLGRGADVARAIALDTIAAATSVDDVTVVVVTADMEVADESSLLGAEVVAEAEPNGLDLAIARGLELSDDAEARGLLLGDLPALRPTELRDALRLAAQHPRSFTPDAEGTGSTLVTAAPGLALVHFFGPDSAQRHRDAGLVELELPAASGLRRDVDLTEHLTLAAEAGLGPRTFAAVSG
ncbi:MAG: 2-phospho-L-lactate guanylyltransferase [Pseudolysinimonas sp.]